MSRLINFFRPKNSQEKKFIKEITNITGIKPSDISYYRLALKHKSISSKSNNERLEYLGDAVLDTVIADYLYNYFPHKDEGFLTQMRTKIVNNDKLNELAIKIGLDKSIRANLNKKELYFSITAKALEAIIGAIYLDKGYEKANLFVLERLIKDHINIKDIENTTISFKSKLVEYIQKKKKKISFNLVDEHFENKLRIYSVNVTIDEVIMGEAKNYSKKKAEETCAEIAYKKIFHHKFAKCK